MSAEQQGDWGDSDLGGQQQKRHILVAFHNAAVPSGGVIDVTDDKKSEVVCA